MASSETRGEKVGGGQGTDSNERSRWIHTSVADSEVSGMVEPTQYGIRPYGSGSGHSVSPPLQPGQTPPCKGTDDNRTATALGDVAWAAAGCAGTAGYLLRDCGSTFQVFIVRTTKEQTAMFHPLCKSRLGHQRRSWT